MDDTGKRGQSTALLFGAISSSEALSWRSLFTSTTVCCGISDVRFNQPMEPLVINMLREAQAGSRGGPIQILGASRSGVFAVMAAKVSAQLFPRRPVRVVLLSPRLSFWPEIKSLKHPQYEAIARTAEQDPTLRDWLDRNGNAADLLHGIEAAEMDVKIALVVGQRNKIDMREVGRVRASAHVRVIAVDTDEHLSMFWLKASGVQRNAVQRMLEMTAGKRWPELDPAAAKQRAADFARMLARFKAEHGNLQTIFASLDPVG